MRETEGAAAGGPSPRRRRGRGATLLRKSVLLLTCLGAGCAIAREEGLPPPSSLEEGPGEERGWTKEQKLIAVNAACAAGVLAYGLNFWGVGGETFRLHDEGWFGQDAENGGSDKFGHAFAGYVGAIGIAALYEDFGYDRPDADLYGALTSMGAMTGIELADGFSHYGFSWGDLIFDAAGVLGGYWRRRVPEVGRYVDYRVEYWPSITAQHGRHTDIATDYSGYKYILALKLDAFEALRRTPAGWLELQVGYYTRGFGAGDGDYYDGKKRHFYFAIALNLSRIFSKLGLRKVGKVFNFYQPPYTYVPLDWTLPQ